MRFTRETAVGDEPSAISAANLRASSMSCARGTARNTKPICAASLPDTLRPVSNKSEVFSMPTSLGNSQVVPISGINPHLTKEKAMLASVAASLMSQVSGYAAPNPPAAPLIAQITGLEI